MIKLIGILIFVTILAIGGYAVYKGFVGDNDNAEIVANKASELVSSVADTFADGAKEIAKEAKTKTDAVVDSAKSSATGKVDSVKSTVKSRIGDIREASKEKYVKAKEAAANKVDSVKKKVTE